MNKQIKGNSIKIFSTVEVIFIILGDGTANIIMLKNKTRLLILLLAVWFFESFFVVRTKKMSLV